MDHTHPHGPECCEVTMVGHPDSANHELTRDDVQDRAHAPMTTRHGIRSTIAELAVATAHPTTRDAFLQGATDDELLAILVERGTLVEEWFVGLRSVHDPSEVLGRWAMAGEKQAAGVCRDWRAESGGANYVVERHLGSTIFVVVPDAPADGVPPPSAVEAADPGGIDPPPGTGAPWCPECLAGKHGNCDGTTLDPATDDITTCPCGANDHPIR